MKLILYLKEFKTELKIDGILSNPSEITWSIEGNKSANTTIDQKGLLQVGATEPSYVPDVTIPGTYYYYVEVTNTNVKTNFDNSNNVISNNNNSVNNTKSNENVQNNTYNAASKETGNGIPFGLFILNAASIAIVAAAVSRVVRGKNKLTKK